MAYVHFLDPHGEYEPEDRFYLRFASTIYSHPVTLADVGQYLDQYLAAGFSTADPRFQDLMLRYDAEIAEVDDAVGMLLTGLKDLGVLQKTFIVVMADHGEEFLDHGMMRHCMRLFWESVHVPFIFYAPPFLPAQRISTRVASIDLMPTLLELAGISYTDSDFSGAALFHRAPTGLAFSRQSKPIIGEFGLEDRNIIRSFIQDDFKYYAAQRWLDVAQACTVSQHQNESIGLLRQGLFPSIDPWGPVVFEDLYDLANDPFEQHSVLSQYPDRLAAMRQMYQDYKTLVGQTPKTTIPPEQRAPLPADQPLLFTISPAFGPIGGGSRITLTGSGLANTTSVMFGTSPSTDLVADPSGSQISVTLPPHILTSADVRGDVYVRAFGRNWYSSPLHLHYIQPPEAAFAADPVSGYVPMRVQFSDTSSPGSLAITQWQWSFGDGGVSAEQNPVHVYTLPGRHDVALTVSTADGTDAISRGEYITIRPAVVQFSASPLSGSAPLLVQFTDLSTPDAPVLDREWDFGDGANSHEQNPAHLYLDNGPYAVSLTLTTANGVNAVTKTWYICVGHVLPTWSAAGTVFVSVASLVLGGLWLRFLASKIRKQRSRLFDG